MILVSRQREHGDRYIPARHILNDEGMTKKLNTMLFEAVPADPMYKNSIKIVLGYGLLTGSRSSLCFAVERYR